MVLTQTAAPALAGVALFGDRVRPGWVPLALLGMALSLAGTSVLARFEGVHWTPTRLASDPPCE